MCPLPAVPRCPAYAKPGRHWSVSAAAARLVEQFCRYSEELAIVVLLSTPWATSGGAAMVSHPDSVLDQLLRAYGIDGPRLVDLPVAPSPLRSSIAAETLTIGKRAGTLMRD